MRFFFIFSILLLCVAILVLFLKYQDEQTNEDASRYLNHQLMLFNKAIDEEQNLALAMTVLLSRNPAIIECVKNHDKSLCYEYINQSLEALSLLPHDAIRIHIHTKDLRSLLRAWDVNKSGDSLEAFRHSISKVKASKRPIYGVEAGRLGLSIRGIAPVMDKDEYVGSIEVIFNYKHITKFLAQQHIDFYVLVDKKLSDLSPAFRPHTFGLLDQWVIVNEEANLNNAYLLKNIDLTDRNIQHDNAHAFVSTPIIDINQNLVGYYVLGVNYTKNSWKNLSINSHH
jgi:hypothetical protein